MARKKTRRAGPEAAPEAGSRPAAGAGITAEERRRMIAEAAYYRAERRGFATGGELEDWILAETEIDRLIQTDASHAKRASRVA
ncbi:MAG TPA: DUF2934 domain-containing protein [Burkholderiales bacterium]|jgi:hypothetical protein